MPAPQLAARIAADPALIDALADVALRAGAAILGHRGRAKPERKADGSPVTVADREAEDLILAGLRLLLPGVPIVSEEAACAGAADAPGDDYLLVDALDGTKEFIADSGDFTVNIALIHRSAPVGGVVYAPASGRLWLAAAAAEACEVGPGEGVRAARNRRSIRVRKAPAGGVVAMASLRHDCAEANAYLERFPVIEKRLAGSSLKFCVIAEGAADVYPRMTPTMEWDTAAGDAVLRAAGGAVLTLDGAPLGYDKRETGYLNPSFIAVGDRSLIAR